MTLQPNKQYIWNWLVIFLLLTVPLSAENDTSLRISPIIQAPVTIPEFSTGIGAEFSLDWSPQANIRFLSDNNISFGINIGGSFASLPFVTGDPLTLLAGTGGLFIRYKMLDRLGFRVSANGGIYQYIRGSDSAINPLLSYSLGTEFSLSPYFSLFADGSYTHRVFSSDPLNTLGAAVGLRLNLSEIMGSRARIRVDKREQFRVFPVSWAWYENNPVATVRVTNDEPNAITNVQLSIYMESYMSQPWTFAVVPRLGAGEYIDVPVTALFNEAMMNLTETVNANGLLQISYRSLGAKKETTSSIQMPIFHRNTLSWDDDRRAAAFVSPYDFAARYFAKYVESAVNSGYRLGNTPPNVVYAAALFEALRLYGISYVIVPATSFVNVSADESVLDNVSFPYQALYYKGGDCSYLSILFCSMLEALGIESAFITIPGHIYIAFDVGSSTWNSGSADIIEIDGRRWLPVELTVPREGFSRAWRTGARQWTTAGAEAALYRIQDCWTIYPSVTVPSSGDNLPDMPQWSEIIRAVEREITR